MVGKILGLVLILAGCFFFYKAGNQYFYGKQSLDWPTTAGTITVSEWKRGGGSNSGYKADIEYVYSVNGAQYHSSFIEYSEFNSTNLAYKFKKGQACEVYYNPSNPQMSVLIPGYSKLSIGLFIGMGTFFIGFPFLFVLVGRFIESSQSNNAEIT
ncbi:MAG: DUF3592 domain-containing protein [Verrucomicrobia bacterium]|jgi:hypothetical protein|nr:DUF3592 domain-containing protein [Verrucomicrobiota bacterium]